MNAPAASPAANVERRSVGAVVRCARAGLRAARALECALFFATGALLAHAAALLSGAEGSAWGVASLCGSLAAASWWLEHPCPLAATARALDVSLRHQGALALAFELEARRAAHGFSAMEELVRARVLARLRVAEAVRASLPSFFLPVAAPAVAGLLLLLVLDRRGAPAEEARDLGALGAGLERALSAGLGTEASDSELGAIADLHRHVRELRARLEFGAASPASAAERTRATEEARAHLEALDRRLAELAAREPALRPRLDEARAWVDALAMVLPPASVEAGSRAAESRPAASLAADPAATGGAASGTGAGSLTGAPPDGTISRPMAEPAPSTPAPDALPGPALGLQRGSFWPAEYDAVVERWVELSRAAQADDAR